MNEPCFYRVSVKGIAIDADGRILLARENDDRWSMLGGGLEHDEDPIVGLRREIYEETGLEVASVSPAPKHFITTVSPREDKTIYVAAVVYEITLEGLNFIPSDECQELRFFSLEEMSQVELFPNVQQLLEILLTTKS